MSGCSHERDVLDLVAIGQWPDRADVALRTHVTDCASCTQLAAVADAVREWGAEGLVPHPPDASVVWYRAQRRARESAARAASRPVWLAQVLAATVLAVAIVWIGPGVAWYQDLWQSARAAFPAMPTMASLSVEMPTWSPAAGWGRVALLVVGALAVLGTAIVGALKLADDQ
ncbi:MAG: hypothetical protein HQ485_15880 [Acidobacteria bacterium]|nr:hypothetical protein [Acidobacteriota bacterium]